MSQNLPNMLQDTISKIREMVDVNNVIGDPITTPDGVTIIPVSKVSVGFGGGGSDFVSKNPNKQDNPFGGGVGGGVKVTPICFLTPHTACRPVSVCLTGLRASPRLSLTSNFIFCKKFPIFEFIFPIFAVCFLYFFNNLPHFLVFAKMQLFRHTKSMQNQNSAKNLLTSKKNSAIMRAYPVRE